MVQFFYPSVAAGLLLGSLATATYLAFGATAIHLRQQVWLVLWLASIGSWAVLWLWLRRFNLASHERRQVGIPGMVLALLAGPVYVSAAFAALTRRRLAYAITAKGELRSRESLRTFRLHLVWAATAAALLGISVVWKQKYAAPHAWALFILVVALAPPLAAAFGRIGSPAPAGASARERKQATAPTPAKPRTPSKARRPAKARTAGSVGAAHPSPAARTRPVTPVWVGLTAPPARLAEAVSGKGDR